MLNSKRCSSAKTIRARAVTQRLQQLFPNHANSDVSLWQPPKWPSRLPELTIPGFSCGGYLMDWATIRHILIGPFKSNSPHLLKSRCTLIIQKQHECAAITKWTFTDYVRGYFVLLSLWRITHWRPCKLYMCVTFTNALDAHNRIMFLYRKLFNMTTCIEKGYHLVKHGPCNWGSI